MSRIMSHTRRPAANCMHMLPQRASHLAGAPEVVAVVVITAPHALMACCHVAMRATRTDTQPYPGQQRTEPGTGDPSRRMPHTVLIVLILFVDRGRQASDAARGAPRATLFLDRRRRCNGVYRGTEPGRILNQYMRTHRVDRMIRCCSAHHCPASENGGEHVALRPSLMKRHTNVPMG